MRTVRLTTCNTSYEAHILKNALQAEGIPSVLHNENMTNLYGGLIAAFTGVDILVNECDLKRAIQIINCNNETDENDNSDNNENDNINNRS